MTRRLAAVLGVAVIGMPDSGHAIDSFDHAWLVADLAALAAALSCLLLRPQKRSQTAATPDQRATNTATT